MLKLWPLAVLALLLSGAALGEIAVRDDYGHEVRLAAPANRIVSLSPHLTELLFAAGAGMRVVGAVEHSDFPEAARALPRVGSDAAIDLEAVAALRPALVVAWPNAGTRRAIERLAALGIAVFRSEPRELEHIAYTLERLAVLAGTPAQGEAAAQAFRTGVARLERRYAGRAPVRAFYQVWSRPLVTVNGEHIISKVMQLCGGENVFAAAPLIAPQIDREAVLRADPDVIIASGAGEARPAWLDEWQAFAGLRAVAHGHLYAIPAELIQRHTPRLLSGAERMCELLDAVRIRS